MSLDAELAPADLRRISALVYRASGIVLSTEKGSLVRARLIRRLRATRIGGFGRYADFVESPEGAAERTQMLRALTTNVTRFFREPHHFDDLRSLLERLAPRIGGGGRLRIWSAACSTGEEAFSIAMEVALFFGEAGARDIKVLATDIDTDVLATARRGEYPAGTLAYIPPRFHRLLGHDGGPTADRPLTMPDRLRNMIHFRALNLQDRWPFGGPFDAIFCRNVLIYFDRATQEQVFAKLAAVLAPGSRLYLGHSERMAGPALARFAPAGMTTYGFLG